MEEEPLHCIVKPNGRTTAQHGGAGCGVRAVRANVLPPHVRGDGNPGPGAVAASPLMDLFSELKKAQNEGQKCSQKRRE